MIQDDQNLNLKTYLSITVTMIILSLIALISVKSVFADEPPKVPPHDEETIAIPKNNSVGDEPDGVISHKSRQFAGYSERDFKDVKVITSDRILAPSGYNFKEFPKPDKYKTMTTTQLVIGDDGKKKSVQVQVKIFTHVDVARPAMGSFSPDRVHDNSSYVQVRFYTGPSLIPQPDADSFPLWMEGNMAKDKQQGKPGGIKGTDYTEKEDKLEHWAAELNNTKGIDLDADSDNNNGFGKPDESDLEDEIENVGNKPGKYIAVNSADEDGDQFPGFKDGFDWIGNKGINPGKGESDKFVRVVLKIDAEINLDDAKIWFTYKMSDPNLARYSEIGDVKKKQYYYPAEGHFRIWLKKESEKRNPAAFFDGNGDFLPATGIQPKVDDPPQLQSKVLPFKITPGQKLVGDSKQKNHYTKADLDQIYELTKDSGSKSNRYLVLYVEAVKYTDRTTDKVFNVILENSQGKWKDSIKLSFLEADIDIDSDNTRGLNELSAEDGWSDFEEAIEDIDGAKDDYIPGKYVEVNRNDGDPDNKETDGVPGFADGFKADKNFQADDKADARRFVPVTIRLTENVDFAHAKLKIEYSASDPTKGNKADVRPDQLQGSHVSYQRPDGALRLWTVPGTDRKKTAFYEGGHFVPATNQDGAKHQVYGGDVLKQLFNGGNVARLYIESVNESEKLGDQTIRIILDPDGNNTDGDGDDQEERADVIRLTSFWVEIDVDSDNNDGLNANFGPTGAVSTYDDIIEDMPDQTNSKIGPVDVGDLGGKLVAANTLDRDKDNISGYLDGFNRNRSNGDEDDLSSLDKFTPVVISYSPVLKPIIERMTLKVFYSESPTFNTPIGHLRLWTKDGDQPRNGSAFNTNPAGDFLPAGHYEGDVLKRLFSRNIQNEVLLFLEGVKNTKDDEGRIQVSLAPDKLYEKTPDASDAVRIHVYETSVDLDIDSDNNNSPKFTADIKDNESEDDDLVTYFHEPADRSDVEDRLENISRIIDETHDYDGYLGKLVVVSAMDHDNDTIPDFADGFKGTHSQYLPDSGLEHASRGFVPIDLELQNVEQLKDLAESITITFEYSENDPDKHIEVTADPKKILGYRYKANEDIGGIWRIWKKDGFKERKIHTESQNTQSGVDFIKSTVEYSLEEFLKDAEEKGKGHYRLYLEATRTLTTKEKDNLEEYIKIKVIVRIKLRPPTDDDPDIPNDLDDFAPFQEDKEPDVLLFEDIITATPINLAINDFEITSLDYGSYHPVEILGLPLSDSELDVWYKQGGGNNKEYAHYNSELMFGRMIPLSAEKTKLSSHLYVTPEKGEQYQDWKLEKGRVSLLGARTDSYLSHQNGHQLFSDDYVPNDIEGSIHIYYPIFQSILPADDEGKHRIVSQILIRKPKFRINASYRKEPIGELYRGFSVDNSQYTKPPYGASSILGQNYHVTYATDSKVEFGHKRSGKYVWEFLTNPLNGTDNIVALVSDLGFIQGFDGKNKGVVGRTYRYGISVHTLTMLVEDYEGHTSSAVPVQLFPIVVYPLQIQVPDFANIQVSRDNIKKIKAFSKAMESYQSSGQSGTQPQFPELDPPIIATQDAEVDDGEYQGYGTTAMARSQSMILEQTLFQLSQIIRREKIRSDGVANWDSCYLTALGYRNLDIEPIVKGIFNGGDFDRLQIIQIEELLKYYRYEYGTTDPNNGIGYYRTLHDRLEQTGGPANQIYFRVQNSALPQVEKDQLTIMTRELVEKAVLHQLKHMYSMRLSVDQMAQQPDKYWGYRNRLTDEKWEWNKTIAHIGPIKVGQNGWFEDLYAEGESIKLFKNISFTNWSVGHPFTEEVLQHMIQERLDLFDALMYDLTTNRYPKGFNIHEWPYHTKVDWKLDGHFPKIHNDVENKNGLRATMKKLENESVVYPIALRAQDDSDQIEGQGPKLHWRLSDEVIAKIKQSAQYIHPDYEIVLKEGQKPEDVITVSQESVGFDLTKIREENTDHYPGTYIHVHVSVPVKGPDFEGNRIRSYISVYKIIIPVGKYDDGGSTVSNEQIIAGIAEKQRQEIYFLSQMINDSKTDAWWQDLRNRNDTFTYISFIIGDFFFDWTGWYTTMTGRDLFTKERVSLGERALVSAMSIGGIVPVGKAIAPVGRVGKKFVKKMVVTNVVDTKAAMTSALKSMKSHHTLNKNFKNGVNNYIKNNPATEELPTYSNQLRRGNKSYAHGRNLTGNAPTRLEGVIPDVQLLKRTKSARGVLYDYAVGIGNLGQSVLAIKGVRGQSNLGNVARITEEINEACLTSASKEFNRANPSKFISDYANQLRKERDRLAKMSRFGDEIIEEIDYKQIDKNLRELEEMMSQMCYTGDTQVLMANGQFKAIKDVRVGDQVLTRSEHDPYGEYHIAPVHKVFHRKVDQLQVLRINQHRHVRSPGRAVSTSSGNASDDDESDHQYVLRTTAEHPFYVAGFGWTRANRLWQGMRLLGLSQFEQVHSSSTESSPQVDVYNLGIDSSRTYFVKAESESGEWTLIWTHNSCDYSEEAYAKLIQKRFKIPGKFGNNDAANKKLKEAIEAAEKKFKETDRAGYDQFFNDSMRLILLETKYANKGGIFAFGETVKELGNGTKLRDSMARLLGVDTEKIKRVYSNFQAHHIIPSQLIEKDPDLALFFRGTDLAGNLKEFGGSKRWYGLGFPLNNYKVNCIMLPRNLPTKKLDKFNPYAVFAKRARHTGSHPGYNKVMKNRLTQIRLKAQEAMTKKNADPIEIMQQARKEVDQLRDEAYQLLKYGDENGNPMPLNIPGAGDLNIDDTKEIFMYWDERLTQFGPPIKEYN